MEEKFMNGCIVEDLKRFEKMLKMEKFLIEVSEVKRIMYKMDMRGVDIEKDKEKFNMFIGEMIENFDEMGFFGYMSEFDEEGYYYYNEWGVCGWLVKEFEFRLMGLGLIKEIKRGCRDENE